MLLLLLACRVPEGNPEPDSVEKPEVVDELDCGDQPDRPNLDPACHDGDELLVEIDDDGPGRHYEWTAEDCFAAAGGSIPDVDAPSVVVQCPPCRAPGVTIYDLKIDITDDHGRLVAWVYDTIGQVCPDE